MYFFLPSFFFKILSCTFQPPLQDNLVYVQSDGSLTERDRIKVEQSAWMLLQLQILATRGQYLPWRINDRLLRRYYSNQRGDSVPIFVLVFQGCGGKCYYYLRNNEFTMNHD